MIWRYFESRITQDVREDVGESIKLLFQGYNDIYTRQKIQDANRGSEP